MNYNVVPVFLNYVSGIVRHSCRVFVLVIVVVVTQ